MIHHKIITKDVSAMRHNVITKMNKYIILLSIIALSLSAAASWAGTEQQTSINPVDQLQWLYKVNPEKDANQAIAKGDFRLMAVYGYTLIVPGIKGDYRKYEKTYGIHPIEGTSDFIKNNEHGKLNALAKKYAEKYNLTILKQKKSK